MSPRKVNKDVKRKEIAMACSEILHEVGIKNLTVAQVAVSAGIGKGTVYEYFENKDDIIFEVINIHIQEYHQEFLEKIKKVETTRQKVDLFFKFVLDESEENLKHFNGYKEYLSVVLSDGTNSYCDFNKKCSEFFSENLKNVISEGVKKGELIPEALELSDGLRFFEKGLGLAKMIQSNSNTLEIYNEFMDAIFKLIEVKK